MILFESTLALMLVAIVLLQVSRRLTIPYPTMLAVAGVVVAALPWAPSVNIDPQLALALFIAPVLLDAAFDLPPRDLRRNWLPLLALAAFAVILTTAAVAWVGVVWAGLPLAAAIALGAIVAPPDAAAAVAMLNRLALPRRTLTVLKGESLLNDATALLIFGAAVSAAMAPGTLSTHIPALVLAVPGGIVLGIVLAKMFLQVAPHLAGTLGGTLFQFVSTFSVWIIADRLHLSAILTVVAYAMTLARDAPERTSPRDRVHSYSVWGAVVFLLNVLAFMLMGLQARAIVTSLGERQLSSALTFAGVVFLTVVAVRIVWVLLCNRAVYLVSRITGTFEAPSMARGLVVSWCGMRGLVTLATALALPAEFPGRDLIVLSALGVVLGTLAVQGLTLSPLVRLLRFQPDKSFERDLVSARVALLDAAAASLKGNTSGAAARIRAVYRDECAATTDGRYPAQLTGVEKLWLKSIIAQRKKLIALRRAGAVDDDVFHALEQELDWAELAASPPSRLEIIEG
jgi:NhaP-type Na+/H+ or K+/H+ antiporter